MADQGEVSIVINCPSVPSAKPSINEGGGIRVWIVAVAAHYVGTADYHLAGSVCRQVLARLIDDRDSVPRADGAGFVRKRRKRAGGDLMGRLGHPVCFQNGRSEAMLQARQNRRRQCSRTRADKSWAGIRRAVAVRPCQ